MLYELEDWLSSGHSITRPPDTKKCPLRIAVEMGFHSMVKLLLQYNFGESQRFTALETAAQLGNLEICQLLVEAGTSADALTYEDVDYVINRPLLECLVDHGLDLTRQNGLAHLFVDRRVKPILGLFLNNRARFPEWEEQASIALCEFIQKNDKKWISLMIWAKADPLLPVPDISGIEYLDDGEVRRETAAQIAAGEGLEYFKMLKLDLTAEQATELLPETWHSSCKEMVKYLLEAGADVNVRSPEEGSTLHMAIQRFSLRNNWRKAKSPPEEEVEHISWLIRQGAKWILPEDPRESNWIRRRLYDQEGEYVVEIIRLLHAGECCDESILRELVDKPKMRNWVRSFEPELFAQLELG